MVLTRSGKRLFELILKPSSKSFATSSGGSQEKKPKVVKSNNNSKKAKSLKEPNSPPSDNLGKPSTQSFPPNQAAGNDYKALELFGYNADTYADLFVDMSKYRLPRPSNKA